MPSWSSHHRDRVTASPQRRDEPATTMAGGGNPNRKVRRRRCGSERSVALPRRRRGRRWTSEDLGHREAGALSARRLHPRSDPGGRRSSKGNSPGRVGRGSLETASIGTDSSAANGRGNTKRLRVGGILRGEVRCEDSSFACPATSRSPAREVGSGVLVSPERRKKRSEPQDRQRDATSPRIPHRQRCAA